MTQQSALGQSLRRFKKPARIAVTILLLGLAFSFLDREAAADSLAKVEFTWLAVGFALIAMIIVFESLQFAQVVREFGHVLTAGSAIRMSLVGRFFAVFTPAMLGNDIYRAMALYNTGATGRSSVGLAAMSRLVSLISLTPVLLIGLPFLAGYTWGGVGFWFFLSVIAAAVIGSLCLLLPVTEKLLAGLKWRFVRELSVEAGQLQRLTSGSSGKIWLWSYAIAQHILRIFAVMAVARAYGITADWTAFLALVPVSLLVAMIPVSIGSWGTREIALVFSLGFAGVPPGPALLTSVCFGLLGLSFALMGAVVWMTGERATPPQSGG